MGIKVTHIVKHRVRGYLRGDLAGKFLFEQNGYFACITGLQHKNKQVCVEYIMNNCVEIGETKTGCATKLDSIDHAA
jgi:hypothetical protein